MDQLQYVIRIKRSVLASFTVFTLNSAMIAGCQALPLAPSTAAATVPITDEGPTPLPLTPGAWAETQDAAFPALVETQFAMIETISPVPPTPGLPITYTPAPFLTGIFSSFASPPTTIKIGITSNWRGIINGERTVVYAGVYMGDSGATDTSSDGDSRRGLIGVEVYSADLTNFELEFYDAPNATGILTITAESNGRLTLASASGLTLYFDVPTRLFVEALSSPVTAPTVTPLPPAMPDAPVPSVTPFIGYPAPPTQSTPSPATAVAP